MSRRNLKSRLAGIRRRAIAASEAPIPPTVRAYLEGNSIMPADSVAQAHDDREDRRRFDRVAIESELTMRRIGGFNFQVALSDLSRGGCKVELVEAGETGDSVIARLPQIEPLGSRICWTEGRTSGIEFLTPLHPAVLDSLLSRMPGRAAPPA